MQVLVRLFGSIRESAGSKELAVTLAEPATVADLRALLGRDHPAFLEMGPRLRVAVDQEVVGEEHVLGEGDEVAFLPPVSGGQDGPGRAPDSGGQDGPGRAPDEPRCWLSQEPLDVGEVVRRVMGPDAGGLVTFVGAVRDHSRGHEIEHLEYEAYAGMAVRELDKIAATAAERWPGTRVAVAHRVGRLAIGDLAVVVAAAAAHRAEAFEAARYAIDTLKQRVPIWKKEVARGGEYWVEDHA